MGDDESVYRQIVHPFAQATLKTECTRLTDFTKIIHDFLGSLSSIYETAGSSIIKLVDENKRKIAELTRENVQYPHTTLTAWTGLLDNFREEGQLHTNFSADLKSEAVTTLQEQRLHAKESLKRIYGYRDVISSTVVRESEQRDKCQKDYAGLWGKYKTQLNSGTSKKVCSVMPTYTAYNHYLLQLTYSNGMSQSALDVQLPNLMQELEAVEHNLHNFILSVLTYTFSRQSHHFTECLGVVSNSTDSTHNINPAQDVAKLGESLVLPPEVHATYLEKEFIPADTEESGISPNIVNGYVAKEEYTMHTLTKKYKQITKELSYLEVEVNKGNKDLDALSKLLATYQENPSYGRGTDIEIQMSSLRHELRLLEMSKCAMSSQAGLLEESGISSNGSYPSDPDDDTKSVTSIVEQGEHEWTQLSMTEMKSCDHCQKPIVLQRSFQCNKCRVNCHGGCRNKVFDCVGQPLTEPSGEKATKLKDTISIIKGAGGIFKRNSDAKKQDQDGNESRKASFGSSFYGDVNRKEAVVNDNEKSEEWWTLKHGMKPPDFTKYSDEEDNEDDDEYDSIDHINKYEISDTSKESCGAPADFEQSFHQRPPLAPPQPPARLKYSRNLSKNKDLFAHSTYTAANTAATPVDELNKPEFPPEEVKLMVKNPVKEGAIHVSVALYEYTDVEESSEAWCAPGLRVDVFEESNADWHKGLCNGVVGYFPSSYLERVPERGAVYRCLYDYEAQRPDELSIAAGQVVFRLEDQNNGWIYGRIKSSRGLFPSSYVEELEDFQ